MIHNRRRVAAILWMTIIVGLWMIVASSSAEAGRSGRAWLFATARTYHPSEKPEIGVRGSGLKNLELYVYSFDGPAHFGSAGLEGLWHIDIPDLPAKRLVRRVTVPVAKSGKPARESVSLGVLPPGTYAVIAHSSQVVSRDAVWFTVSGFGLVTKQSAGKLLVLSVDLLTGEPIEGVSVRATAFCERSDGPSDTSTLTGVTGADGLWQTDLAEPATSVIVTGGRGSEFQIANSYYWYDNRQYRAYVYTDRPVYRPGNTVGFKGIVRRISDPGYEVAQGLAVSIEIRDPMGNPVSKQRFTTGEWGSFDGSFALGKEPALGEYSIATSVGGEQHWSSFVVAEYRKPEWSVSVKFDREQYIAGDTVGATVDAAYYFGAPVQAGRIAYRVYRQRTGFVGLAADGADEYWGESQFYEGDEIYWQEFVTSGEAVTDDKGRAHIEFAASSPASDNYAYIVVADVSDSTGKQASGSANVVVTRGLFDVNVRTERYVVAPAEKFAVVVQSVDSNGRPCAQKIEVSLWRRKWHQKGYTDAHVSSEPVSTSVSGEARITLEAQEPGEYIIRVKGSDERGNILESSSWIWVAPQGAGMGASSEGRRDLAVVADRKNYKPGDTINLVVSGAPDVKAVLITVEDREIRYVRTVFLEEGSASVEVHVDEGFAPNTFVSVVAVGSKIMQTASTPITVETANTSLIVEIQPNREHYRPGETATFLVATKDLQGDAVASEVSFALVDEAIFAVKPDNTPDIDRYFHGKRPRAVTTENSFPQTYYGGAEKDGGAESDRRYFPDTAAWFPSVMTDANGHAVLKVTIPDSLTTWRATARAHSKSTLVGQATTQVKVSLPLSVRLALPRFYTMGDKATVATVVHNDTRRSRFVVVTLKAEGADIDGRTWRYVRVAPFSSATLEWEVTPSRIGEVVLSARARSWFISDGVEMRVPVQPFGEAGQARYAGQIGETPREVTVNIPEGIVPGSQRLWADLSTGYLGVISDALEFLVGYPYGCVEQTMSSFLPDVVASQVQSSHGIESCRTAEQLLEMVSGGLARLYKYQHSDGGFGWWEHDRSDIWMTSYVLYGYSVARSAGYEVSEPSMERAIDYLSSVVASERDQCKAAFGLYVLSQSGALTENTASLLARVGKRVIAGPAQGQALAFIALAARAQGMSSMADAAISKLVEIGVRKDGQAIWRSEDPQNPWRNESAETTAWVLVALVADGAHQDLAAEAARHLAQARNGSCWRSTRESAAAVMALAGYVDSTGESLDSGAKVTISVNGKTASTVQLHSSADKSGAVRVDLDPEWLQAGANTVTFGADGGSAYFSLGLDWHIATQQVEPFDDCAVITREYFTVDRSQPRDKQGRPALIPVEGPIQAGQEIWVSVHVKALKNLEYMAFEDPVPSGFEISDDFADPYSWNYWYHRKEVRDNRLVIFAGSIAAGKDMEYDYIMVPERPGDYLIMPTAAWSMYYPDLWARGVSGRITVEPRRGQ